MDSDMLSLPRRDIFADAKVILCLRHSDIIFALALAKRISLGRKPNITVQQYHSP